MFVDESCSHCGKMTISELQAKCHYLKRGGAPLPLPQSSSRHGGIKVGPTSGSSTGGLRVTVMANPPGNQPSRDHRSSCELPKECVAPSTRSVPAVSLALLPTTGCKLLPRRVSRSFLERKIWLCCCPPGL